MNSLLLLLGLLCHMLPLMFRYAAAPGIFIADSNLQLSRASSIVMLVAYIGYIFFQLKTHRQIFESQEVIISKKQSLLKNGKTKAFLFKQLTLFCLCMHETLEFLLPNEISIVNKYRKKGEKRRNSC